MDAFISGDSVVLPSGSFAANPNSRNLDWDSGDQDTYSPPPPGPQRKAAMAERTSNLISSYKSYISGEDEEAQARSGAGGVQHRAGSGQQPLMRDWNRGGTVDRYGVEMQDILDEDERSYEKKYRYNHPFFRSRKFKYVSVVAILTAVIVLISGGVKRHRKREAIEEGAKEWESALSIAEGAESGAQQQSGEIPEFSTATVPEFNSQQDGGSSIPPKEEAEGGEIAAGSQAEIEEKGMDAASALVEEVINHKQDQQTANVEAKEIASAESAAGASGEYESITRHVMCCNAAVETVASRGGDEEETNLSESEAAREYAAAEAHGPKWYGRDEGWKGTTYAEALEFCVGVGGRTKETATSLCPYEVYCPTGPHHIPFGGTKEEATSRSPIVDHPDGWVQVGTKNMCVKYTLFGGELTQAMEDEIEAEIETNVKVKDAAIVEEEGEGAEKEHHTEGGPAGDATSAGPADGQTAVEAAARPPKDADFASPAGAGAADGSQVNLEDAKESRPGPADGQTAVEAAARPPKDAEFASPAAANADGSQVSLEDAKASRPSLSGDRPASNPAPPGIDPSHPIASAISSPAVSAGSRPALAAPASTSDSSTAAGKGSTSNTSELDITAVLHKKFKPLWLGRKEGWDGGSHEDAVKFCESMRNKKLCPYSAMCPHGPSGVVMGGRHAVTFSVDGEQYAPVLGGENHWVQIGTMGDGTNVCKTHRQLNGHGPEWGVNKDNEELKRHVMCCTV